MKNILITIFVLLMSQNLFAKEHLVVIERFAFTPAKIDVANGDTIIFTNQDSAPHSVIPRTTSVGQFSQSQILRKGESFTMEISSHDDISAQCGVHLRMPGIEINVISENQELINNMRLQLNQLDQMID